MPKTSEHQTRPGETLVRVMGGTFDNVTHLLEQDKRYFFRQHADDGTERESETFGSEWEAICSWDGSFITWHPWEAAT